MTEEELNAFLESTKQALETLAVDMLKLVRNQNLLIQIYNGQIERLNKFEQRVLALEMKMPGTLQ